MDSDAQLLSRIIERDAQAFEELMRRHREAALGAIARIVREAAAAEDLVQELFLRVWTRAEQFAGGGTVRGWILRIGTNLALNYLRSLRRRKQQSLPLVSGEDEDAEPMWLADLESLGPEELLEIGERRERLRQLMQRLPEEKRQLMELIFDAQLTMDEAARKLGIPSGTAKSRVHYTMKRLGDQWRQLEAED